MIGILVVTHGNFAHEIVKSGELIIGPQHDYKTLGLLHGDNIDKFKEYVEGAVKTLNDGDGVLMFVDIYGGSPFNAAAMGMHNLSNEVNLECIIGVNLPMVLEAFLSRDNYDLQGLKKYILDLGVNSIKDLKEELKG